MNPKLICSIIIGVATAILIFAMYIETIGFLKLNEAVMTETADKSNLVKFVTFFYKKVDAAEDPAAISPYYRNYRLWFLDMPFAVAAGAASAIGVCTFLLGFVLIA